MKQSISFSLLLLTAVAYSQSNQLKLTNLKNGNIVSIKEGDKVLLAFKTSKVETKKKPAAVYVLSKYEQADSIFVVKKGRIITITDSTLILKESNSLLSSATREIRIAKINTVRKLSVGNQIFRTATTATGSLAFAIAIFYSYVATGGGQGLISGMFEAAGTGFILTRFGKTKISKKQLDNWKIELVKPAAK